MRSFSPLLILIALLATACGGAAVLPDEFTRERADGKIPVSIELIKKQTLKEIEGMPEGQAKAERWQIIEADYNTCRLSSSRKTKAEADKVFADCMSRKGYVYMYRLDAEQLHGDIAGKMVGEHRAAKQAEEEARLAAEQKVIQDKTNYFLRLASLDGNVDRVRFLLTFGANPNAVEEGGWTALIVAAQEGHAEIVKMLLAAGANPNAARDNGVTALIWAGQKGYPEVAKSLLAAGANPNMANEKGETALIVAVYNGRPEIVKILIDADTNLEAARYDGRTALMVAGHEGYSEIAKILLAAGANPNATDEERWTALIFATDNGHAEVVKVLLAAGANPNDRDDKGWTALLLAASEETPEVVKILLACGANPDIENNNGADTWYWAKRHPIILPILEEYREKVAAGWKPKSCKAKPKSQQPQKPTAKPKETA